MRWKIEVTWHHIGGGCEVLDERVVIDDLAHVGSVLTNGPVSWVSCCATITELVEQPQPKFAKPKTMPRMTSILDKGQQHLLDNDDLKRRREKFCGQ